MNEILSSGQTLVVVSFNTNRADNVSRLAAFRAQYEIRSNLRIVGGFQGPLNNDGARIQNQRPDSSSVEPTTMVPCWLEEELLYDDPSPWPVTPNGTGPSLH